MIAAGATVLAAIITGFLAAVLKHRWDVESEKLKYNREDAQRWGTELRQLYASFLVELERVIKETERYGKLTPQELFKADAPTVDEAAKLYEELRFIAPEEILGHLAHLFEAFGDLAGRNINQQGDPIYRNVAFLKARNEFISAARAKLVA